MMAPRPQRVSREDVLHAALELIDDSGVEHLTMRRLGAALGADPMTAYRHFGGKAELTAALADAFWIDLVLPTPDASRGWRDYALDLMRAIRSALAAHPGVIPIVATHPISSPAALASADEAIGRMLESGAPLHASLGDLVNVLVMLTVASALCEYSAPAGTEPAEQQAAEETDDEVDEGALLAALPNLGRIMADGWAPSAERQFTTGIAAVLDGWSFEPSHEP